MTPVRYPPKKVDVLWGAVGGVVLGLLIATVLGHWPQPLWIGLPIGAAGGVLGGAISRRVRYGRSLGR